MLCICTSKEEEEDHRQRPLLEDCLSIGRRARWLQRTEHSEYERTDALVERTEHHRHTAGVDGYSVVVGDRFGAAPHTQQQHSVSGENQAGSNTTIHWNLSIEQRPEQKRRNRIKQPATILRVYEIFPTLCRNNCFLFNDDGGGDSDPVAMSMMMMMMAMICTFSSVKS